MARSNWISYTMNTRDFSELRDFFSAYFHEDWALDAEDPSQVVSSYLAVGWSAKELNNLASQMLQFAESMSDDAALEKALLTELGCYYTPSADKVSAREWLQHFASELRDAAQRAA